MEFIKTFRKLRQLKLKTINGKSAILFLLNRKISALADDQKDFGKLVDIQLDREARSISFDLVSDRQVSTIGIKEYRFIANRGQSYLTWSAINFMGPAGKRHREIFQDIDRIEISKRYISMLEVMM